MEYFRFFTRRTIHLPLYDKDEFCVFCGYSNLEHDDKMNEIKRKLCDEHISNED